MMPAIALTERRHLDQTDMINLTLVCAAISVVVAYVTSRGLL